MIPISEPSVGKAELANVIEAVKSGWVSSRGRFVSLFEEDFAHLHGMTHAISTSNGTNALHLALAALGVGPGDEVIVPSLTFVASGNSVRYCGARPVFVDTDARSWQMDPAKIEKAVTKRTKAIMAVHLYGHACDMDAIVRIAKRNKLFLVEDNAEGLGSFYKGRRTGTMSDISCFSFYGNKVMTTGEGGMCLTRQSPLARRMAILRDHGMSLERKYWHEEIGFNYRMTNIQAAMGVAQLKRLPEFLAKRKTIASWYDHDLASLRREGLLEFQPQMKWSTQNHWMYCIALPQGEPRRKEIMDELYRNGVETRPLFYPLHTFPPYAGKLRLPVAEELSERGLTLPMSVNLTRKQVRFVASALERVLRS